MAAVLYGCRCGNPLAGGGTDTENGVVLGKVAYMDSTAAAGATVYLRPAGYLPLGGGSGGTVDSAMTDSTGAFSFDTVEVGTYAVEVLDGSGNGFFVDTLVVAGEGDTAELEWGVLQLLGDMSGFVPLPIGADPASVHVQLHGLGRHVSPDAAGAFTITGLAPAAYSIHVATSLGSASLSGPNVGTVPPGQALHLDTLGAPSSLVAPQNVTAAYDSIARIVTLAWGGVAHDMLLDYRIDRFLNFDQQPTIQDSFFTEDTVYVDNLGPLFADTVSTFYGTYGVSSRDIFGNTSASATTAVMGGH
jgi:hypothetical protein